MKIVEMLTMRIPFKYLLTSVEVAFESADGFWAYLNEGYVAGDGEPGIHTDSFESLLKELEKVKSR